MTQEFVALDIFLEKTCQKVFKERYEHHDFKTFKIRSAIEMTDELK